jgi:pyruvate/2-oxoglutarate dehydrogenase complex dihydrolipoamide dehydrogenase (E3) component
MAGNKFEYDMGIIGGGAAGLTVASGAAQLGAKVVLIEKEAQLGGDCLHFGCVPSKTLIKSAHVYHLMGRVREFGLPAMNRPAVDFAQIAARIRDVIAKIQQHDSVERFCDLGALIKFGTARFLNAHTVALDGETIAAKNWVIASGSAAFIPPIPGLAEAGYLTNKEIFSMESLPVSLIILGAGPIGCEIGQALQRLGTQVTICNRSRQILSREDADMADAIRDIMTAEGVHFKTGVTYERIASEGGPKKVIIRNANGSLETLQAEAIFVALGRTANTQGLGLAAIGVKSDHKGIRIDQRLRTARKHIYAAGDVIGKHQFTHAAGYEGGIVVSNAIFHLPRKADYTHLPWCTYTHPGLASIGLNEKRAAQSDIKVTIFEERFSENDRSLAEGETHGKVKLLLDEKEKPVGIQILGANAGEILSEWVAALNGKIKLTTLAGAIHPYPTVGEISKKIAGSYLSPKIFSDRVKKGLKLFFNLKGRACSVTKSCHE